MPRTKSFQLDKAFNAAYKAVKANQQSLNAMDGYNGNHGDNTAGNLKVISQAVKGAKGRPPSEQLRQAAEELAARGQGGTAPHYVNGLREAAQRFEGQERLGHNDIPTLLQSLMGQVPAHNSAAHNSAAHNTAAQGTTSQGPTTAHPSTTSSSSNENQIGDLLNALGGQGQVQASSQGNAATPTGPTGAPAAGGDILSALLNMAVQGAGPGAGSAQQVPAQPQVSAQDPFGALLGGGGGAQDPFAALLGGGGSGAQSPSTPASPQDPFAALIGSLVPDKPGLDLADVLQAGSAFMGAQAQGADTTGAALQAVMAAMRSVNPMDANSPRTASGGLIAQGILDSLIGKKK